MHPIERLRYVARATHVPPAILARETAMALADFVGDDAGLLIACRRILDRQPTSGPLVWLAAHILGAPNQRQALWNAVDELEEDQTIAALAYSLPDNPIVATVGWSEALSDLTRKRGDLAVVLIDTDGSAEYQVDRLIDDGHAVTVVDAEASAQAYSRPTTSSSISTRSAPSTVWRQWDRSHLLRLRRTCRSPSGGWPVPAWRWANACTAD